MSSRKTKIVLICCAAISGAALSFIGSNYGPWTIDRGVGFGHASPAMYQIELTKELGDVSCWLRLRFPRNALITSASLDDGTPLAATPHRGWWRVTAAAPSPSARFVWYAGRNVELRGHNLDLQDWELFREEGSVDTAARQRRRTAVLIVIGTLTLLAGVGTVFSAWPEPESLKLPFTPETCVLEIIQRMEAHPAASTRRLRELMMRSLVVKDIGSMGLTRRERGLLLQGRNQLRNQIDFLLHELSERRRDLD